MFERVCNLKLELRVSILDINHLPFTLWEQIRKQLFLLAYFQRNDNSQAWPSELTQFTLLDAIKTRRKKMLWLFSVRYSYVSGQQYVWASKELLGNLLMAKEENTNSDLLPQYCIKSCHGKNSVYIFHTKSSSIKQFPRGNWFLFLTYKYNSSKLKNPSWPV